LNTFGVTSAGEFSNAINDCGLYVRGIGGSTSYGGDCAQWEDSSGWSLETKEGLKAFAMATMDALQNWFFWTWKIGESSAGRVQAPLWSYQLGLREGWMPTDPRTALGKCDRIGASFSKFEGPFQPWQTGGVGAGVFSPAATAGILPYPPELNDIQVPIALLPTYTSTGPVQTLPPTTFSAPGMTKSVDPGDGWFNSADTGGGITTVAGCVYPPDPWRAIGQPVQPCEAAATIARRSAETTAVTARDAPPAARTPAPSRSR